VANATQQTQYIVREIIPLSPPRAEFCLFITISARFFMFYVSKLHIFLIFILRVIFVLLLFIVTNCDKNHIKKEERR
jgi:hypothetical protein